MSNNRLEVRHVVEDAKRVQLLPGLAAGERADFVHDADLVIRGLVAQKLGLDLAIVK
jgi:hypothetical protein